MLNSTAMAFVSCVLIGEGNILLSSLQQLVTFRCEVKAVFSDTEQVRAWCHQRNIPVHPRGAALDSTLRAVTYDYLFSINNPRILREEELKLACKLNVNYHDSLLPAYAGVNASSWALLHGETRHGVTLHVVEAGIDTGDVLESQEVDILPTDSALSLNLRCVEAFHSAFARLVRKITGPGRLTRTVQDSSKRSYFGLYACPPNMGLLNFHHEFRSVHNLARALEYGHHENPLGSPKVLTCSGRYLLVTSAETTRRTHTEDTESGTIVDIVDDTLIVKTATDLILLSVAELDGSPIHDRKFQPYGLTAGSVLQSPRGPPADIMSGIRKKEGFWRRKMQKYEPTMFLRQKLNIVSDVIDVSDSINVKELTMEIFPKEVPAAIENEDFLLMASFFSFLARICCTNVVHIGLVADRSAIPAQYKALYADICPGIFELDLSLTSRTVFNKIFHDLERYKSSRTFLKDAQYRYPELGERRREMHHNLVIATPDDLKQDENIMENILLDCNMLLVLTMKDVRIYYNEKPNHDYNHIIDTLKHYPAYVSSLCALTTHQSLLDIDLLSAEERAVLYPLPDGEHDEPDSHSDLFAVFQKQCVQSPSATALKTTSHMMTYSEVEKVVNQLAMLLEQNLPESYKAEKKCVGLHLPNSTAYVLSVLASVRVRCPFLPLPADLPTERLAFTLRDAKVTTMITTDAIFNSEKFKTLPSEPNVLFKYQTPGTTLILVQFEIDENDNVSNVLDEGLPEVFSFDNLQALDSEEASLWDDCCYVMYTSGSTGKPKGVQVSTANVANLAAAQIQAWDLQASDTIAQFASIGFDASISEIMTALLSGGTLAVLQENERLGQEFVETLRNLEVSVITLPPSVLNIYGPRQMPTLRKIITAGEACISHTAFKWTQHDPDVKFFNAYGPTETTVCATIYEFRRNDYKDLANQELAIGTAIRGVYVYLLDDFMKPVPPEVVGEIYIGGAGVSGGYIGHASNRNASRFIPNPLMTDPHNSNKTFKQLNANGHSGDGINGKEIKLSPEPMVIDDRNAKLQLNGKKSANGLGDQRNDDSADPKHTAFPLYRTGDHAFQDQHGRLTFVGRLDDQVKIRGQRVDLNEIEQVILQHSKVEMAVVVRHRCPSSSEATIAAFVAPTFIYTSELKEYLSRALPRYMIPTYIRKLKAHDFPTTINGKVNRRAMETDESVHESQLNVGNSHLNEAQLKMAKLWCRVLSLEESYAYSMHRLSSFSELGGNSLHLVIMQRVIEETFHVNLSFLDVGAADTIESFTDIIKRKKDMLKIDRNAEDQTDHQTLKQTILEDSCLDLESLVLDEDRELSQYLIPDRGSCGVLGDGAGPLKILISGVTGFLGAFLLHELLEQTECQVLCMVREKSEAKGMGRVVENLKRYDLWRQSYFPRLAIVLSDVSEDRLGIAPDIYRSLCLNIDVVFINAAKMNFNTSYDDHRQANVLGTTAFLRLALSGKKKFLFLTSSLSVFLFPPQPRDNEARNPLVSEADFLSDPLLVEGGYGQSKWASERLVLQALDHLPGGAIFRPARVSGRSTDGAGPRNDLFASCLMGMQRLGSVPDLDFPFDLTPVDFCAKAMVEITAQCLQAGGVHVKAAPLNDDTQHRHPSETTPDPLNRKGVQSPDLPRVFHLFNRDTLPFKELFEGTSVHLLPLAEWRQKLRETDDNSLLLPLTPFFLSSFWDRARHWPVFDTSNTDRYVSQHTQRLLTPSRDLLQLYKRYFKL